MANDWSKYEAEPDNGSFDRAMKTDFSKYQEQPQNQGGLLDKYGDLYDIFHENIGGKYLGSFGAGVFEPLINAGISAINAPLQLAGQDRVNHLDLHKYLPEDYSKAASFAGNLLLPLGVGGKAIQAINKIPIPKGIPSYYGDIAKNSAASALFGENEEGNRLLATLLGGGLTALHGAQSKVIGEKILNKYEKTKNKFKELYNSLFDEAKEKGVRQIKHNISPKDVSAIGTSAGGKAVKELKKISSDRALRTTKKEGFPYKYIPKDSKLYKRHNSFKELHDAQSEVGKIINDLSKKAKLHTITPDESKALDKAIDVQKRIRKSIDDGLKKSGVGEKYKKASEGYKKELGPMRDQPSIRKAALGPTERGRINPEDLPSMLNLIEGTPFRNAFGREFPELAINKYLPKVSDIAGKYAVPITAGSYGLTKLIEALSGSQQGSNNATY